MKTKTKTTTTLVLLIAVILSAPAYGRNVTVIVEGVFAEYTDPDGLLPFAEPAPGSIFTISVTYDDATPDEIPEISTLGIYINAILDAKLTIGTDTFAMGEKNSIVVLDDSGAPDIGYSDGWSMRTTTSTPTGISGQALSEFFGFGLLTSLPLPPVPPQTTDALVAPSWPSGWDLGTLGYSIDLVMLDGSAPAENLAYASANITSITVIPIPAAVWLFGSALGLLGWIRRKAT